MPAGFWTGGGATALWHDMDTFTVGSVGPTIGLYQQALSGCCKIYQEPVSNGDTDSHSQNNPGYDSGFFYAKETSTGVVLPTDGVFPVGQAFPAATINGQWVRLQPWCIVGDLLPESTSSSADPSLLKDSIYRTGFQKNYDATNLPPIYIGYNALTFFVKSSGVSGTYRMWHYNPWAWSGTPPEVATAAAMYSGLSSSQIDQTAFDDAHDAYNHTTGDAPYNTLDQDWTIYARRTIGNKVADFLLECAEHGRDPIFVNEEGKLSTNSWTNPTYSVSGLDLQEDQFLSIISHTRTRKHLYNSVSAGWGSAAKQSWTGSSFGPSTQAVGFEPNLESRPLDKWVHEDSVAASITKYGQVWLKGKKAIANFRGQPQEIEISHFPFILTPHVTLSGSGYTWDASTDGGGLVHITYWLPSDSKPRSEVKAKQGLMGLDTGIGDEITNLSITGDGKTIATSRVIEKKYNFDDMTVESLIMEVPPNT
jgi:hypothetical protein